jgi:DNA-binding GntR family transcriptional regulator
MLCAMAVISERAEPSLLADQVYTRIQAAIMHGDLPAGARLRIRDLAAEVGTSVMPVREAIRRLEQAGLAERVPHKGAVVRGLTLAELVRVYDVRLLLEVEAARLGSRNITAADVERMHRELELMQAAIADREVVDILDHDEALLTILYEASDNSVLVQTIHSLWQQCRGYKILGARAALESGQHSLLSEYQERLVAAARSHNGDAAAALSALSLTDARGRVNAQLSAQDAV